jgi:hypothetical protein
MALAVALLVSASAATLTADAAERRFIRTHMGVSDVLIKIGRPDHEAFVRDVSRQPERSAWTCCTHPGDPPRTNIRTFRAGVVTAVDRTISR